MTRMGILTGLAAAIVAAGLAGSVAAAEETLGQGGTGPMAGMDHTGHGRMAERFADPARLATLKTELAITSEQTPAWDAYAKAVQDAAAAMQSHHQDMDMKAMHDMSPQDRQDMRRQMRSEHQEEFAPVRAAAEQLLAVLDDGQKAKARQSLPGLAGPSHDVGRMGMHHHMGMGRGEGHGME